MKPLYRRILLKLSGEALSGPKQQGVDPERAKGLAESISVYQKAGVQCALVIGAGNFFRGVRSNHFSMDRPVADHVGMLATCMNAHIFQQVLEKMGVPSRVFSALGATEIAEPYRWKDAMRALEEGEVVLFAGGTSCPYFSTDTASALRACEIEADILLKATKVDGVYDRDPELDRNARRFTSLTYGEALDKNLKVLDGAAFALCRENTLPIRVFSMEALEEVLYQPDIGTLVQE